MAKYRIFYWKHIPSSLVVEGAGGVMVPLNGRFLMIDLMKRLGLPVLVERRIEVFIKLAGRIVRDVEQGCLSEGRAQRECCGQRRKTG